MKITAGVDEVGRGSLMGPVYADEIGRASLGKECRSRWSPYH